MRNKIFILASERSGTNLLRTLIGNHKNIEAPVAPHFLNFFTPLIRYYGDLKLEVNNKKLIQDFIKNANHPFNDWNLHSSANAIYKKYTPTSYLEIFDALYLEKAQQNSKNSYCSKGIHNFNYVSLIKEKFPSAKFIYLYRDPRDHTASWLKTPLFMHTSFQIIQKWNSEQNKCINLLSLYPNSIHSISYEKLIQNTKIEMTKVLNFLEEEVDQNCFQTNKENKESQRNELWKNLSNPIITNNFKKYKKTLSLMDIFIIESLAKENMLTLSYTDFETKADWNNSNSKLFQFKEKIKRRVSKTKNKRFHTKKMADLNSKLEHQKQIIASIKNK